MTSTETDTDDTATSAAGEHTGALSGEVTAALLELSPEHRAIVVGRFVLDWSETQVAAALEIRPGTAIGLA